MTPSEYKWDFFFDVMDDGRVLFRATDMDTALVATEMFLPPRDADAIGDALKQQAERSRRKGLAK